MFSSLPASHADPPPYIILGLGLREAVMAFVWLGVHLPLGQGIPKMLNVPAPNYTLFRGWP